MAYTKKENVVNGTNETETIKKESKPRKKSFKPDDMITCVSVTPGELFFVGPKTKDLYTFADINDTVEIAFNDLDYAAKSRDAMVYRPRFIIQDDDFLKLHKGLSNLYDSLHSVRDLKSILFMNVREMEAAISTLPSSTKESLKTLAITMIDNGTLDSVQKVKKLDSIFDTEMLLRLTSK